MMIPARRGWFVALEGPDGSGKTTQVRLLAESLKLQGHSVVVCRDPGGTTVGDEIRSLLLDRSSYVPTLRAEMLLYMASRAQLVDEVIRPALASGAIVVSDRFLLSNIAYQGSAGGLDSADIREVGRVATGGLVPDLTIVVDVAPEVATARIGVPRDRMEERSDEYRRRVREGFLAGRSGYNSPSVVVDGVGDPEQVHRRIREEVQHALGLTSGA